MNLIRYIKYTAKFETFETLFDQIFKKSDVY